MEPTDSDRERRFYDDLARNDLIPLWTEIGDLMPRVPTPKPVPHLWRWNDLLPLGTEAGELVPVGRGGERRAIALANPGLSGRPFATPTLWAAIQYLNPNEHAPDHRHSQNAFRFVVEGEGVWTIVGGDSVAMRRGDFLPQAGWNWHGHRNESAAAMAWIDGLDIPLQSMLESTFFEPGDTQEVLDLTPDRSRSERLWAHPGLAPVRAFPASPASPLLAYRWESTDRALDEQLALEDEGHTATVEPGHAAVRYVDPRNGADVLPTIRADFHRLRPGVRTATTREVASSVYQMFEGEARVTVADTAWDVGRGDLFVVPSWQPLTVETESAGADLFRFTDAPVFERLALHRSQIDD